MQGKSNTQNTISQEVMKNLHVPKVDAFEIGRSKFMMGRLFIILDGKILFGEYVFYFQTS